MPGPDPILGNANLTDSAVADALVDGCPLQIRMLFGAQVRELIKYAIGRERERAAGVVTAVATMLARRANAGGPGAAVDAHAVRALLAAAKMVQSAPGACARCGGRREVPSGLAGPGGQPLLSPCPVCSSSPDESPASVSEISAAKPSEG
jgi:hypothetical protein